MNSSLSVAGANATAAEINNYRKDLLLNQKLLQTDTYGANMTIDLNPATSENSSVRYITLTGNVVFTLSNMAVGQILYLFLKQGGSGGYTPTWFANIKWPSATTPTLSTTVGTIDVFTFFKIDATTIVGFFSGFDCR
jgi:hypothetical protein